MVSFEKKTMIELGPFDSPATAIGSNSEGRLVTGHDDGILRVWDPEGGLVTVLPLHEGPVESVAVDRRGQIYSGGRDGRIRILDRDLTLLRTVTLPGASAAALAPCAGGLLAFSAAHESLSGAGPQAAEMLLLDPEGGGCTALSIPEAGGLTAISAYFDGRLMVAFASGGDGGPQGGIAVLNPADQIPSYVILGGHAAEARDCITMGPRIISCGSENAAEHTLKIWGTEAYVASEHARARLMPKSMPRPPYYRSIF
jgi:WD40 repeat protein